MPTVTLHSRRRRLLVARIHRRPYKSLHDLLSRATCQAEGEEEKRKAREAS